MAKDGQERLQDTKCKKGKIWQKTMKKQNMMQYGERWTMTARNSQKDK